MRRAVAAGAVMATLAACGAAQDVADTIARERAKTVVNSVVAKRLPGVNAAPVTDCIIDAASAGEIIRIARTPATGVTEETAREIIAIAGRPEAVDCIARNSASLLGG